MNQSSDLKASKPSDLNNSKLNQHKEIHKTKNIAWLRAAVLGANDGIVSTASLLVGVAASQASTEQVFIAGVAGLVAGAMSMAAGEYVSVSSQSDIEKADLNRERQELIDKPEHELEELRQIYISRGLEPNLAKSVAIQLMEHDALAAHARDELGISEIRLARPIQAAVTSAITFSCGAILPLLAGYMVDSENIILSVSIASIIVLAFLGGLAAKMGGANILRGISRVVFWGALAMGITAGVGIIFGVNL